MAGPDIDLSSFTDLMTCILGVLVLIILLTGIDASQISVLVATPKEITGDDKSPVFFECRNQQLFYISTDDLKDAVDAKTEEIRVAVAGDPKEFLKQAAQTMLEVNGQKVDYTMALVGKYELIPIPDAEGYSFDKTVVADEENWYASKLATIDVYKRQVGNGPRCSRAVVGSGISVAQHHRGPRRPVVYCWR